MTWPLVKFVDAPSVSANVRMDCNDVTASASRRVAGFDPGVPALTGDPDGVGQAFGLRQPTLTVRFKGSKANAMAALSAFSKEQMRWRNWVMFQPSALQQPVWFRTYRAGFAPLSLDRVFVDSKTGGSTMLPDTWECAVPLAADPFAYGARVTIPTFQVIQGPVDLTGPTRTAMRAVLPAIKGDAPTKLRVKITPAGTNNTAATYGSAWLLGCISGDTASITDPQIDIGTTDGFTAGTGTGGGTTDANYFGGTYRAVTIGAGSGVIGRLSGIVTVSPPQGRYKVMLRCEADSPINVLTPYVFTFGVIQNLGTDYTYAPSTVLPVGVGPGNPAETFTGWVDLGETTLPAGVGMLPADVSLPTVPLVFSLKIGTSDGSAGAVRLDRFKLIPVDGGPAWNSVMLAAEFLVNDPPSEPSGLRIAQSGTFDGDDETYWTTVTLTATDYVFPGSPCLAGGFPVADPAREENLLIVMATADGLAATTPKITSLNAQAAVDVSYHPRYLYLGDGT